MSTYVCYNPDGSMSELYDNVEDIFENIVKTSVPNGEFIIYNDNDYIVYDKDNENYIYVIVIEYPQDIIDECYNFLEDKLLKHIKELDIEKVKSKFVKFLEEDVLDYTSTAYKVYISYDNLNYSVRRYEKVGE